uniref:Uncharacterized protein n=1 Tax=Oncorhynchus mykiss TaxID=8022 RepID=A0A8C7SSK0_ONCMY
MSISVFKFGALQPHWMLARWDASFPHTLERLNHSTTFINQTVFQSTLLLTHPGLQFLELLLASLHGQILSLIQTVLQVLDCDLQVLLHPLQVRAGVSLHLLLHPQGVIPAPDLRVQGALHGVNHPLAVPLDLLHLLILLSDLPVHLTLDLVQLQLHTQNLGFLVLQCALDKEKQSSELCSIY